jgi:hypothetical protein
MERGKEWSYKMLDQIFQFITTISESAQAALIISLAMNIALSWGWWRREQNHLARYDTQRSEWIARESEYLKNMTDRESEVAALGKEAFSVLQNVAGALAGMERTIDGIETMVQMAVNRKLNREENDENKQ